LEDLSSGDLCGKLDKIYKDSGAVLILDQFEELLRQDGRFAEKVVKWIISIGYGYRTHVVISLRTDSLHHLDPLLRGVKPFSMDRVNVGAIEDEEAIKTVIETRRDIGDHSSSNGPDPEAIDRLLSLWRERGHRTGLLDLQAALYVLYFRTRRRNEATPRKMDERGVVDRAYFNVYDVEDLMLEAERAHLDPFTFGLRESIRLKIDYAEKASRNVGLDEYLILGTREIVRRAAPLFSSGEFKIPIHEVELAQRTLVRERQVLRPDTITAEVVARLFSELRDPQVRGADLLTVRWWDIALPLASTMNTSRHRGDVSAGPMMSAPASATLLEEIRRVAFAIEWLDYTEITRKDDDGWLLLVHDGSGSALNAWADKYTASSDQAFRQLTASRGEHYVWDEEIGGDAWRVIANLNWRDCRISTRFRNVVFVNCDFSGSRFDTCTFQGVTFVNCLLDDANFEYCKIRGVVNQPRVQREPVEAGETRLAPSFTVEATGDVRFFAPYLEGPEPESLQFFSDTSGRPAIPGPPPESHQSEVIAHFTISSQAKGKGRSRQAEVVTPTNGGVAMVGGRLCFLTLYRCRSEEGGSFSFHHVSGGGLDIVEQYGGGLDIHDGVIRGISVTRDEDPESTLLRPEVELTVNDSIVANLCFSGELKGSARFENSRVLMLINGSENSSSGFRVGLDNCRYQFLVNTDQPEGVEDSGQEDRYFAKIPGSDSRFEVSNREALAGDLETMDYRSRPEVWEDKQRQRRATTHTKAPS
jgi:hypothetical protein